MSIHQGIEMQGGISISAFLIWDSQRCFCKIIQTNRVKHNDFPFHLSVLF